MAEERKAETRPLVLPKPRAERRWLAVFKNPAKALVVPSTRASRRWLDAVVTAVLGTAGVLVAAPWATSRLATWAGSTSWVAVVASDVLLIGGAWLLARKGTFGELGLKRAGVNPPPLVLTALTLAFLGIAWSIFPESSPSSLRDLIAEDFALLGAAACLATVLVAVRSGDRVERGRGKRTPRRAPAELPQDLNQFGEILQWISTDDDIHVRPDDRFGHWEIACRIADRLSAADKGRDSTFAIVGELGSGKSTVLSLVRARLAEQNALGARLVVASTSLWPFESTDAAIRGVLSAIRSELGKQTTTIAIASSAEKYLRVVEKADKRFGYLADLLSGDATPRQALSDYDRLASLIGVRLVVWIEDLEHFAGEKAEGTSAIRALLYQLQQFDNISVVLATSEAANGIIDPGKIARFLEVLPKLGADGAWPILQAFREGALKRFPDDVPLMNSVKSTFLQPSTNPYMSIAMNRGTLANAVSHFCSTPRLLKHVLRATHEAWSRLHGELFFDHLLIVTVLRVARPRLFAILTRHIDRLVDRASSARESSPENLDPLDAQLRELCIGTNDYEPATKLIDELFPRNESPPQGLGARVPRHYWERYLKDVAPCETERDQAVLRALRSCESGDTKPIRVALSDLDQEDAAAHYAARLSWKNLLRILGEIVADRALESSASWPADAFAHRRPPGIAALRQALRGHPDTSQPEMDELATFIGELLAAVIPKNLALAYELQDRFFGRDATTFPSFSPSQRLELRRRVVSLLVAFEDKPLELSRALEGSLSPVFVLLAFGIDRIRAGQNWAELPFPEWPSIGPTLLEAARLNPHTVVPTILYLVVRDTSWSDGTHWNYAPSTAERLFDLAKLKSVLDATTVDDGTWTPGLRAMLSAAQSS